MFKGNLLEMRYIFKSDESSSGSEASESWQAGWAGQPAQPGRIRFLQTRFRRPLEVGSLGCCGQQWVDTGTARGERQPRVGTGETPTHGGR